MGAHAFDRVCTANRIEHRLTKPRTPQTNGMSERFNGRIAEVLATTPSTPPSTWPIPSNATLRAP